MLGLLQIFCGFIIIFICIYYYATWNYKFWLQRKILHPKPLPLVGNFKSIYFEKSTKPVVLKQLHETYVGEPIVGIYDGRRPALLLRDASLFKEFFTENFNVFPDRGIPIHEKAEPFTLDLFCLDSKRWRPLRQNLSPGLASGRLKEMFEMVIGCSELLDKYIQNTLAKSDSIPCRDMFARFAVNVIGVCAFGIELHALEDEHSEYHEMCENVLKVNFEKLVRYWLKMTVPWFYDCLGYVLPYSKAVKFFLKTVRETLDYRKKNNILKRDFVHQLQYIKTNPEKLGPDVQLTDILLAAQAFVFFTAGFDATAITLTNVFYELAQHPEIQEKLRNEIKEEVARNNGTLTYECINTMKYLQKVFQETLRKYPPIMMLLRKSTAGYRCQKFNLDIPEGMHIFVSITGIHHDPTIYPKPEIFDPERFNEENIASRHPMTFLPFGVGPRMCIGARFANNVTKAGIATMLLKYKFEVCSKTEIPYAEDPSSFLLVPKHEIYLKVSKLN